MKKPKLNLNKDGIQQFLLANGEKFLLGITAVVLLGFFYSALTAKPLDDSMSPDSIKTASNSLQTTVGSPTWDQKKTELNLANPEFESLAKKSMEPLPVVPFREPNEWEPALFPDLKRRAEPKVYAIEELQAASGAALLAQIPADLGMTAAAPTTISERAPAAAATATNKRIDLNAALPGAHVQSPDAQGKPYVIVTGLIPIDKQAQDYNDKYALAMPAVPDPNMPAQMMITQPGMPETPQYALFTVERAEIADPLKPEVADKDFIRIGYKAILQDLAKWASAWSAGQDIVDPNYLFIPDDVPMPGGSGTTYHRVLTTPLPPLLLKDWGLEAAHPKVKLFSTEDPTANPTPLQDGATPLDPVFGGQFPDGGGAGGGATKPAPVAVGTAPLPAPRPAQPAYTAPPVRNFAARGRSDHDERPVYGGNSRFPTPQPSYSAPAAAQAISVPNKLFRFVDFTVEPGKTYRYRFQLYLFNPNYALKADCLLKAESATEMWVKSPLTEPTPPITVPHLYRVLAEGLTGSRNSEPKAKINVWALFKAPPSETAMTPNPPGHEVWVEGMREIDGWVLGSILSIQDLDFSDAFDLAAMEMRNVKATVETNQPMLLDVRNEDPLGATKSKWPTEMLTIDAAGRLSVANSAVDHFAKDEYTQMKTSATAAAIVAPVGPPSERDPPRTTPTRRPTRGRDG